jgi:UDP-glucose 4-epimerase
LPVRRAEAGSLMASRILVLGGLGFLGANLSQRLAARGDRVTSLTRSVATHPDTTAALTKAGIEVVEGDLGDAGAMQRHVPNHDVIINLAGESGAVRSVEAPLADLDGNCRANLVLLDTIRSHNPSVKLVFVGSRLQYGKPSTLPVDEDHSRRGLSVHAVHKNTIEEYLRVYAELFGLRYTVARVTNPFGPGQPAARVNYGVVNRLIHLALADQPLPIYGDGAQRRDYVYVDDVSEALVQLADSPAADGRAFNVGSGVGTALIDMANAIIRAAGGGRIAHVPWPRLAEQIETGDFIADITRIEREIGWRPGTALSDGLEKTVAFQRQRQPS